MQIQDIFLRYWSEVDKRQNAIDFGMGMPNPLSVYSMDIYIPELINGLNSKADYQPQVGTNEIRSSIASFESKKTGISYNQSNVMLISGGIRGFSLFVDEFANMNTNFIELLPSYPLLSGYVEQYRKKYGGNIIRIKSQIENDLRFDISEIVMHLKPNSIVFFTNPNNPTGQYYPQDLLAQLLDAVYKKQSFLVIDEACDIPYNESVKYYESPNVIRIKSLSKDLLFAGFRIGYIIAHPNIIKRLSNRYMLSDGNAPFVTNKAIVKYLDESEITSSQIREFCQQRYAYMHKALLATDLFSVVSKPQACYYLLAKTKLQMSSWDMFIHLLNNGVNIVPGVLFGLPDNEPWIRLCFARDIFTIDHGIKVITTAMQVK